MVWVGLLCLMTFGTAGGCAADSATRIAFYEQALTAAQGKLTAAESQVVFLQAKLAEARAAWSNPALPAEQRQQAQAVIDKLSASLTEAETYRKIALAVEEESRAALEKAKADPSIGSEVDFVTQIVQSVAMRLGPQGAAWGTILVMVLSIVAAALKARQVKQVQATLSDTSDELVQHSDALTAVVKGIEKAPAAEQAAVKASIKAEMKTEKVLNQANELIDNIKAGM